MTTTCDLNKFMKWFFDVPESTELTAIVLKQKIADYLLYDEEADDFITIDESIEFITNNLNNEFEFETIENNGLYSESNKTEYLTYFDKFSILSFKIPFVDLELGSKYKHTVCLK